MVGEDTLTGEPLSWWSRGLALLGLGEFKIVSKSTKLVRGRTIVGFRPGKWLSHFEKHGDDLGYKTAVEYLRGAQHLANNRAGGDILRKIDPKDGIIRTYNKRTNEFVSIDPDGTIRTYFKPKEGFQYWERQPGQ